MAAYFPNLRTDNISLYTVPIFWVISLAPRFLSVNRYREHTKGDFDLREPREFVKAIEKNPNLDPAKKAYLRRAEAAVLNGMENFGLFAAAVTAGSAARLDPAILNGTTIAYLISRIVYTYVYVNNESKTQAGIRALTYDGGVGLLFSLFIQAGIKLRSTGL